MDLNQVWKTIYREVMTYVKMSLQPSYNNINQP